MLCRIWFKRENRFLEPYLEEDPLIQLRNFGGHDVVLFDRETQDWTTDISHEALVYQLNTRVKDGVGQYIYEGDIVQVFEDNNNPLRKCIICYDYERAYFCAIDVDDYSCGIRLNGEMLNVPGEGYFTNRCWVMGNIFENEGLLND